VVPADDKESAGLIVSQIVVDTLAGPGMSYPEITCAGARELQVIRDGLVA